MRYLIDTNILVYLLSGHYKISREVQHIFDNYENRIYVSSESIKEILCLFHERRVQSKTWKYAEDIFNIVEKDLGIVISYVKKEHLLTLATLLPAKNHNDHCDHIIIAHAITERIPLVSSDRAFEAYREQKLDFIYNKR